ncbi:MAG: hypothetical protein QXQ48_09230 [Nitrososphaerota archaeon]
MGLLSLRRVDLICVKKGYVVLPESKYNNRRGIPSRDSEVLATLAENVVQRESRYFRVVRARVVRLRRRGAGIGDIG